MRRVLGGLALVLLSNTVSLGCEIGDAILETRESASGEAAQESMIGQRFMVTAYAERLDYVFNAAAGDRRVVGWVVARLQNTEGASLFAGTWKVIGSPFTGDESWTDLHELPQGLQWLQVTPILTDSMPWERGQGEPLPLGSNVFSEIENGPLRGLDLVYVGCLTN